MIDDSSMVGNGTVPSIVILTGAGVSAESGLATFRGPDGLWDGHRVEDVASPEGFARDPVLMHRFYNARRAALDQVEPNAAHLALARLDREWPGELLLITQNVDDLHERAGSRRLLHLHGELRQTRCGHCGEVRDCVTDLSVELDCPGCGKAGGMRPHIVWFGETPMHLDACSGALAKAGVFIAIGTSGQVYPAASFVTVVASRGSTRTLELNLKGTGNRAFDEVRLGPASDTVPALVDELLRDSGVA